jgi:hypothetical protein
LKKTGSSEKPCALPNWEAIDQMFEQTVCLKECEVGDIVFFRQGFNSAVPIDMPIRITNIDRRLPDCVTVEVVDMNDHLCYLPGFQRCERGRHVTDEEWEAEKVLRVLAKEKDNGEWINQLR